MKKRSRYFRLDFMERAVSWCFEPSQAVPVSSVWRVQFFLKRSRCFSLDSVERAVS